MRVKVNIQSGPFETFEVFLPFEFPFGVKVGDFIDVNSFINKELEASLDPKQLDITFDLSFHISSIMWRCDEKGVYQWAILEGE
jgi:hypothetical protein